MHVRTATATRYSVKRMTTSFSAHLVLMVSRMLCMYVPYAQMLSVYIMQGSRHLTSLVLPLIKTKLGSSIYISFHLLRAHLRLVKTGSGLS